MLDPYCLQDVLSYEVCGGITEKERQVLYDVVRCCKPEIVVETGSGASTLCILLALQHNHKGVLYSLDCPGFEPHELRTTEKQAPEVRQLWKIISQHYCNWQIYDADIVATLPLVVNDLPKVDFFFHDSRHTSEHASYEYEIVEHKMKNGSIFGMHDVGRKCYVNFEHVLRRRKDLISIKRVAHIEFWEKNG